MPKQGFIRTQDIWKRKRMGKEKVSLKGIKVIFPIFKKLTGFLIRDRISRCSKKKRTKKSVKDF